MFGRTPAYEAKALEVLATYPLKCMDIVHPGVKRKLLIMSLASFHALVENSFHRSRLCYENFLLNL